MAFRCGDGSRTDVLPLINGRASPEEAHAIRQRQSICRHRDVHKSLGRRSFVARGEPQLSYDQGDTLDIGMEPTGPMVTTNELRVLIRKVWRFLYALPLQVSNLKLSTILVIGRHILARREPVHLTVGKVRRSRWRAL